MLSFSFCALLLRKNGTLESSCCTAGVAHWALSIYRCWQEPYKGTIWESLTDRLLGTQICHMGYEFTLKADIGGYTSCLPPLSLSPSREPGFRLLCWKPSPPQMGIKRDPTSATWSRIHVFRDPVMLFVSDPGLNVCRSPHHAVASAGLSMALVTFPINLSPPPNPALSQCPSWTPLPTRKPFTVSFSYAGLPAYYNKRLPDGKHWFLLYLFQPQNDIVFVTQEGVNYFSK